MAEQCLATGVQMWESREVGPVPGMPLSCHLTAGRFLLSPRAFSFSSLKGGGETLPISSYKLLSYVIDNDKCGWCFFRKDGVINTYTSPSVSLVRNAPPEPPK